MKNEREKFYGHLTKMMTAEQINERDKYYVMNYVSALESAVNQNAELLKARVNEANEFARRKCLVIQDAFQFLEGRKGIQGSNLESLTKILKRGL